jgi:beta-lactamase superfamily II metal-dependent hydrolase
MECGRSLATLVVATVFVRTSAAAAPDPRTRVSFLASGEGDATFIRTGEDYRILINGTGEPNTLLSFLGEQLPPWDRRLDLVVATHLDNDNLSSLNAVLERYNVGQVVEPPAPARPGVSYEKWRELIETQKFSSHIAEEGTVVRAGEAIIEVVHGDGRRTTGDGDGMDDGRRATVDGSKLILRLTTRGQTFLLAPALDKEERQALLESDADLDADVAVLPNEIEEGWVERVTPDMVVLFVGRRPQDKPTEETVKLLEGVTVLRTDERGTVQYALDGDRVTVQAQK